MNKINRKIEYALAALKHMSIKNSGKLTTTKEVCEASKVPFDATARVMQIMAQKGLLKSEQGKQGGYLIVKDLSKVNLHDLVEMILGPTGIVKCINPKHRCDLQQHCQIQEPLFFLNEKLVNFYKSMTLLELLNSGKQTVAIRSEMAPLKSELQSQL